MNVPRGIWKLLLSGNAGNDGSDVAPSYYHCAPVPKLNVSFPSPLPSAGIPLFAVNLSRSHDDAIDDACPVFSLLLAAAGRSPQGGQVRGRGACPGSSMHVFSLLLLAAAGHSISPGRSGEAGAGCPGM